MDRLEELKSEIYKRTGSIAAAIGVEIVDNEIHAHNGLLGIQVLADLPGGGIGLEECTKLNHQIDRVLFEELGLGETYTLEVSSPGLDRWLVNYRDLRRVIGRDLHVFLREPVMGRREMIGTLTAARENEFILEVKFKKVIEERLVPMDKLEKAKQVII